MASQYNGGRGGGRVPGRGGPGRGGPYMGGRGPPAGAWQPAPPQQPQQPQRPSPGSAPQQAGAPPPQMQPQMYGQYPQQFYAYGQQPYGGQNPQWRPPHQAQAGYPQSMRGGVFYPPAGGLSQQPPQQKPAVVAPPRQKRVLTITDKHGNPLEFTPAAATKKAPASDAPTADAPAPAAAPAPAPEQPKESSEDAGAKLRKAIQDKIGISPAAEKKESRAPAPAATPEPTPTPAVEAKTVAREPEESARKIYSKETFLKCKYSELCMTRPPDLPDMKVIRAPSRQQRGGQRRNEDSGGGGGGGGGNSWSRGNAPPRRSSQQSQAGETGGNTWSRGQAPPKQQKNDKRAGRGRGNNSSSQLLFDGPVAPLVKSENHWRPRKNTSALVVAEKAVKAILNKMTKEKFDTLATKMLSVPLTSYEMLKMMINNVYDKAIDEPSFGDIYADLCTRLSKIAIEFLRIIESDEEPPTEDASELTASTDDKSSHHAVYRWSNDVSTTDDEIIGPFDSSDACLDAAMDEVEHSPVERGEMLLDLVSVSIKKGVFIKIMKKKTPAEGETAIFYTVYFPVKEAAECGQQLSQIFLSEVECVSDATKQNSFKRSLLNKCEDEFQKQDIYEGWKEDMAEYEAKKSSLSAQEQAETEGELNFRRIRIKKQMLGNVKFIGQLYKKGLLKEKIMRYCIAHLLKLDESTNPDDPRTPIYKDSGNTDIDEEDHEAICSMFTTIGKTIDTMAATEFMKTCFDKIATLSNAPSLPSRSRFMYKDLIELRQNSWVPRRKEENAKTIAEIRKDVEREEKRQAQQSMRGSNRGGGSGNRNSGDARNSGRFSGNNRSRQPKVTTETDADGFTVIGSKAGFTAAPKNRRQSQNSSQGVKPSTSHSSFSALATDDKKADSSVKPAAAVLDEETLERRIKRMRNDFMGDGGDLNELLTSWDEISATPQAGEKVVGKNCDRMMDCKEDERVAIVKMLISLVEKGKLTKSDVRNGLVDTIEFIDSMVMDSPRAYEYLGDILGEMLRLKAVDVPWMCEQLEKTKVDPNTRAPGKIVTATFNSLKKSGSPDAMHGPANHEQLAALLGDEAWKELSADLK